MASGYVVAALLEAAGLIGLVIATLTMRAERRAKAAELRGFLRSGQASTTGVTVPEARRHATPGTRFVLLAVPPRSGTAMPHQASAARSALGRAIVGGARRIQPDLTASISAG
jgi:hypothetical protein